MEERQKSNKDKSGVIHQEDNDSKMNSTGLLHPLICTLFFETSFPLETKLKSFCVYSNWAAKGNKTILGSLSIQ